MLYGREERTRGLAGLKRSQSARPLFWRCSFDRKSDEEVKVEAFKDAVDGTMHNNIIDNSLASQRHIVTEGHVDSKSSAGALGGNGAGVPGRVATASRTTSSEDDAGSRRRARDARTRPRGARRRR